MKLKTNNILLGLTLGLTVVNVNIGIELNEQKKVVETVQVKLAELQLQHQKLTNNNKNLAQEVLNLEKEVQEAIKRYDEQKALEAKKAQEAQKALEAKKAQEAKLAKSRSVQTPVSNTESAGKISVNIVATFYSALGEENGGYAGINALGGKLKQGSLAVPKDIPLGSKFYIEGYGNFVADDRGGAIKRIDSNTIKVDIFVPRNGGESDDAYRRRVDNMGRVKTTGWYTMPT